MENNMGLNREQIAVQIAGQMASMAIDTDWIVSRSFEIADAIIRKSNPTEERQNKVMTEVKEAKPKLKKTKEEDGIVSDNWITMSEMKRNTGLEYHQVHYRVGKLIEQGVLQCRQEGVIKYYKRKTI